MGMRVAVAGASGYAGGELLRLLAGHPEMEIVAATARSQAGAPLAAVHPHLTGIDLTLGDSLAGVDADLVFLALPHGESAAAAAQLPDSVKVVDLAMDHRYVDGWVYGLPELSGQRERIAASRRVANTGCYAVATILAAAPLIASGVASPDDIVVVAASGTSGAGRGLKPHLLATEVMGDLSPYRVGQHQHVPEIKQATGARSLSFTPVLAPMPRGILATVTLRPLTTTDARAVLQAAYVDSPFVHVLPEEQWPHTAATLGSNACHLQATVDSDSGRIIVVSAIDNLGKGAAGQAVQCANLMAGLPETTGLSSYGMAP